MGEVIVITSGKGGVGKTTTTANLGSSLAEMGKKVVLVDTDIGLRNLDVVMGLENRIVYDIVDVVEEKCKLRQALIKDKRFEELFLLPAAQTRDKSAINEEQMKELTKKLKEDFDYILIDCPAGIEQGFKNAIAGADRAIVVTTAEISAIRDADRIIGLLESSEIKNPELIVNRLRPAMVSEGGNVSIDGTEESIITVTKGTEVTVRATPNDAESYIFAGWYDGDTQVSNEAIYTFTVTTDITLTAKFVIASCGTTTPTEYTISPLTGTFTNASGNSVTNGWASTYTFSVSDEMPAQVTLTSTQNGTATNLLHANSFDFISTENSEWILSVPEPYKIVSYSFSVTNSDVFYGIYPTISAETQSITLDRNNSSATFEVNDINKSTTSFTIKNGDEYNQLQISNFVVQIASTTTGIENIAIENEDNTTVYDLSGRRVQNPSRGIYIVNGKKVYIK